MRSFTPGAAVAAALALLLWTCSAGGAVAHAVLVSSSPADGARLTEAPDRITLTFSEPVVLTALRLIGPGATSVAGLAESEVDGAEVRLTLPSELPRGGYVLSWRLTSIDGHAVAGALTFGIGADAGTVEPTTEIRGLSGINRAVHYAALLAAAGGAFFLLLVPRAPAPGELRRGLARLAALAALTLFLSVGLGGLDLTGGSSLSLFTAAPWLAAAQTSLLPSAGAGLVGLLALIAGLRLAGNRVAALVLLGAGALVALTSLALTGHAASASPHMLSVPAIYLHGLCAAFWIGSLWPLWVLLRRASLADAEQIVRRFSRLAVASVLLLITAGTALSVVQVEALRALVTTSYGRILLVKLGVVALLLGLAVLNRQILTPRLPGGGVRALRCSIAVEMLLGFAVVTATAFLGQTPPPRALATGAEHLEPHNHMPGARPWSGEIVAGDYRIEVEVHPARIGNNHVLVSNPTRPGQALGQASMRWSLPSQSIEGLERPLDAERGGVIDLPLAGDWQLRIEVLVSDFEKASFETTVPIRP